MAIKPILFSTPMVQAIIAGNKNQTRRIVKSNSTAYEWLESGFTPEYVSGTGNEAIRAINAGDILWVRETTVRLDRDHVIEGLFAYKANCDADSEEIRKEYIKSGRPYKWKPSIFMPKEACRIFIKVTSIKVERLNEISQQDAEKEGVSIDDEGLSCYDYLDKKFRYYFCPQESYKSLWESINGKGSWETNPWVWVYEFERVERPEGFGK